MVRLAALLMSILCASADAATVQAGDRPAVAMVARVAGPATVDHRDGRRALRLFDRLADGDVVRTSLGSDVIVAFRSGARARVTGPGEVTVRRGALEARSGVVQRLAAVPTIPLVAAIAGTDTAVAAVRIRADALRVTAPAPGETVVADAVTVSYRPAGAEFYDVEIERSDGAIAFRQRAAATEVVVPASAVVAGAEYRWTVTARWPTGFVARADGHFRTLAADAAREREALHAAVDGDDAESQALGAEVDLTLGLWREALARFRAAHAAGAVDEVVQARIRALERRLAIEPSAPVH